MKFVVKQAAPEAPAEKPVELSLSEPDSGGWVWLRANRVSILALTPDGHCVLAPLLAEGFVADTDDRLKVRGRIPG